MGNNVKGEVLLFLTFGYFVQIVAADVHKRVVLLITYVECVIKYLSGTLVKHLALHCADLVRDLLIWIVRFVLYLSCQFDTYEFFSVKIRHTHHRM